MRYSVDEIKTSVRILLGQNSDSEPLEELGDIDTLSTEQMIEKSLVDAVRIIEANAPHYLLDSGRAFGESIEWKSRVGYGMGYIHLPDDFMRLVTFQMSDWSRAVTEPITADDPKYAFQSSRCPGLRGTPQKPVVAIVQQPIGLVLEFYSCRSGSDAYIKYARYIPYPRIKDGEIEICEKLREAIEYYTAGLVGQTIGLTDLSVGMINNAKELMK